jgi:hypothetical protein
MIIKGGCFGGGGTEGKEEGDGVNMTDIHNIYLKIAQ